MTKLLSSFLVVFLTTACIKTAEQVQREKRIDSMTEQMSDSQSLLGEMNSQLKEMQSQFDRLHGRVEELEHRNKNINSESLKEMNENVALIKTQREADSAQLTQIQSELKEQRVFIEKVIETLGAVEKSKTSQSGKKKSAKEELVSALTLIKKNKYTEARTELETLIDNKDLGPADSNKVLYGLGKIEFYTKNFDKALTYFSKIFTKYPKSSLAPSSLLFIGKTLKKMSKSDEAKEAFAKVIEDYPATKEAGEAKKEL